MLEVGQLFERKYVIEELLGAGGFALVYRAHQPDVDRDVAIKILRPAEDIGTHPATLLARFQREAKMAAELRNEHNIHLFDFGRSATGFLYMIFEYVDGFPLDEMVRHAGALAPARVARILKQVLVALGEAHKLGILHRDVKPQNIIIFERLGEADRAKLIDYGIAKPMGSDAGDGKNITAEGHVVGTPRYMAPEQILMSGELTPATDIYSLGLVAYEMLAGRSLLGESTHTEVIKRQLSGEVFRVPTSVAAPPGLRRVVDTMLAKSARDRYQSADDALADLEAVDLEEEPATVPPVEELLETLGEDSNQYISEERPTTGENLSQTLDSRPSAQLERDRERVRARVGAASGPADRTRADGAPPTRDSNPDVMREALAEDAARDRSITITMSGRSLPVLVGLGAMLFVLVVGAAIVVLRPDVAEKVEKKVAASGVNAGCDGEDEYEPNNRSFKGTPLHAGSKRGFLCPGDVDWFKLGDHRAGDVVSVGVEYDDTDDADDIDIEMFVDNRFVAGTYTPERVERITEPIPQPGTVAVRLYYPVAKTGVGKGYRVTREMGTLDAGESTAAEPGRK